MTLTPLSKRGSTVEILLVEDSHGDVLLMQRAFKNIKTPTRITVASDGEKAISLLKKEAPFESAPTPDLVLLDINLPKKNGHEVLYFLKNESHLKSIPVIMLSSSQEERDIAKSYELNANSYLVKSYDLEILFKTVESIEKFWFENSILLTSRMRSPQ